MVGATTQTPRAPNPFPALIHAFGHAAIAFWPIWMLPALAVAARIVWALYRLRRLSRSGISEVDEMDGRTFELFLLSRVRVFEKHLDHFMQIRIHLVARFALRVRSGKAVDKANVQPVSTSRSMTGGKGVSCA